MADTCPDCKKHYMRNYADNSGCDRIRNSSSCATATISLLRARVAELEQAHAEQVTERELSAKDLHTLANYVGIHGQLAHNFVELLLHVRALAGQAKGDPQ